MYLSLKHSSLGVSWMKFPTRFIGDKSVGVHANISTHCQMDVLPGFREGHLRLFLNEGGQILTTRLLDRFQLLVTAIKIDGRFIRGVLDQKSRLNREIMHREKYESPYIVELPLDHPEDTVHVKYSVSLPRTKKVIALHFGKKELSSSDIKPKIKRFRTAAQLLGEKDYFCCRTCFKRFSRKFNLQRHENACLPKPILFQCPICHRKYQKAPYFAEHIRKHEAEENSRQCVIKSNQLAIENANMEEMRRKAEESVEKLAIPYEFGSFL